MRDVRRKNLHAIWRKFKYIHIFIICILFLDVHGFVKFKIEYTERINQKFNETKIQRVVLSEVPWLFLCIVFSQNEQQYKKSMIVFWVLVVGGR